MKKLLLFITGLLSSLSVLADTTYTLTLDGAATQSTSGYFTVTTGGGFNTKYTGTYNGVEYSRGLKINSSSSITFTTKGTATVIIVQSTSSNGTNQFKFDGTAVANASGTDNPNAGDVTVREYTMSGIAAGTHTITNGGETGILYVSVTEAAATSPTVKSMPLSAGYALGTPIVTPLSVEVDMVDADNDQLYYQWYVNTTNSTDGGTAIAGAESSSYTPDISAVGTLYYYCVIVEKDGDGNQVGNPAITNTVAIDVISSVEAPTFSEINGTVEISCATAIATVYYSTDNGTTWIEYTRPFTILDNDATVLAKAQVGGGTLVSEISSHNVEAVKAAPGSSSIVLYYDTTDNFELTENDEGQAGAALTGKEGTDYEDWKIQVTGTDKTISYGSAINGKTTIKGSNGRQMRIKMPDGYVANRITIYSYINLTESVTDKSYWKEVAKENYGTSSIPMASWTDVNNPDVRVFALNDVGDEITLNNAGRQLCFYAVVDYTITAGTTTLNSKGFATISSDKNVIVSGAQAYTCILDDDVIDALPIESNIIPAYNGVLLYGEPNKSVLLSYYDGAVEDLGENDLKATTTAAGLAPLEDALVLSGNAFKRFTGNEFDLNKAYLPYSFATPAKGISIRGIAGEEEEATEVTAVEAENTTNGVMKTAKNGRLVIETAKGVFNMAGARIK